MNKYVNIKNLFMCTIMFIGVLIFILLSCFSVTIVAVDDFSIPLFFEVVVSAVMLTLGILLMNTFMTANDFVSIFFPLFKFSFVLCFLFSVLELITAFYFVKKK